MTAAQYKPYQGPNWFYIVLTPQGEPTAVSREYVPGARCCLTKSKPVNEIEKMDVHWHAGCWSPLMRCIYVAHFDVENTTCRNCYHERWFKKTFVLTGKTPDPL